MFKSGFEVPSSFRSAYFGKIPSEKIERVIARQDGIFEKLRLRNMSASPLTLYSKTLEARNLESTVAISSASRFIPQGYCVRRPDGVYSATPTTGRIAKRADRANIENAVVWASEISDLLIADDGVSSNFIRNFAKQLDLTSISPTVSPTFVSIDIVGLSRAIFDVQDGIRLVRKTGSHTEELNHAEAEAILSLLDQTFPVQADSGIYRVLHADDQTTIANLRIGKSRIGLKNFQLPELETIFVERRYFQLGEDLNTRSLADYIDREDLFIVVFDDLELAYIEGTLFRDEGLVGGGETFLAHLKPNLSLATATSEKGEFQTNQVSFSPQSVFQVIVDQIAAADDVLLCDDLGDEWADFIGISTGTNPVMISFYHAKHGVPSLSASAFHISVGQAIKNLGRMTLPADMLVTKLACWDDYYRHSSVQTQIHRMIRGGSPSEIEPKIQNVQSKPDVLLRVFIVTSCLSRTQVEDVFANAAQGISPPPHFVQLYWLLVTYFSACAEMGVRGYVICRP